MEREKLDEVSYVLCTKDGKDCYACWAPIVDCECEENISYEYYKKECN